VTGKIAADRTTVHRLTVLWLAGVNLTAAGAARYNGTQGSWHRA
jgi:hypothetical protein